MNDFGFLSSTITVYYQTGLDANDEPVIGSSTYRNVSNNVTAAQIQAVAQALVGLTDYTFIETVKTTKDLVAE